MSEQRCRVMVCPVCGGTDHHEARSGDPCGMLLEPTGGPCLTCGMVVSITAQDGDDHLRAEGHTYLVPLACPVHGEQP